MGWGPGGDRPACPPPILLSSPQAEAVGAPGAPHGSSPSPLPTAHTAPEELVSTPASRVSVQGEGEVSTARRRPEAAGGRSGAAGERGTRPCAQDPGLPSPSPGPQVSPLLSKSFPVPGEEQKRRAARRGAGD